MSVCLKRIFSTLKVKPWACLKLIIFCLCLSGFVYQGMEFMRHYWTYPTVMEIMIEKNRDYVMPALTFCNANSIQRSKFCGKYPQKCALQNESSEICTEYPYYCEGNSDQSLLPKIEAFEPRPLFSIHPPYHDFTVDDLMNLGQSLDSFVHFGFRTYYKLQGPYIYAAYGLQQNLLCYSMNSRVDEDMDPAIMTLRGQNQLVYHVNFLVFPEETFNPSTSPGVYIHIHSPLEVGIPSDDGILLTPGSAVRIRVKVEEEYLLPHPYKTNCTNYTEIRESRNKTGPRSADLCRRLCDLVHHARHFDGCNPLEMTFPILLKHFNGTLPDGCRPEDEVSHETYNYDTCQDNCKEDCLKLKYSYTMSEVKVNPFGTSAQNRDKIYLHIHIESPEVLVSRHKPKYENVEMFSTIGGVLGIWLGISLFSLADIMNSACTWMISKMRGPRELCSVMEI